MTVIDNIVAKLSEVIPRAWKARPKEQGSWRTLKVGDTLVRTDYGLVYTNFSGPIEAGEVVTVTSVDSGGMKYSISRGGLDLATLAWTNPDWRLYFTKVRKAKKAKGEVT